ncbi:MAG: outer rane efflux protein [Fibrobacteria bacterium]|nr:outer rane efflux protein [Fibrobacteria bacterium]
MNRPMTTALDIRGLGSLILAAGVLSAPLAQAPLTLAEALATVRKNSDETQLIRETSVKLDAQKSELWAAALPTVSAYANAGRGNSPFNLGSFPPLGPDSVAMPSVYKGPAQNSFSYGVQAQQTLFSFALGRSIHTAGKLVRSQDAANRRSVQELELATLDAFYGVVIAEANLRVIEASLERQSKTAGFLESNFRRGAGSRSTLLLTQASLKGLQPQRIRAERDAEAARMAFNRLLGRSIEAELRLDTTSVVAIEQADVTGAALSAAVDHRPDLEALRLQREALQGYASVYRGQYLPSLGVQGKVGILAFEANEQLTDFDNNLEWQVGIGLTWPLFDGMGNSSKARQYDSDARSVAINERRARNSALIEIESAKREVAAADSGLSAAKQARDASAEALELISQDFRAGSGNVTDLLSAEEGLRGAESGLLAARYQKARAKAALRVALGMNLTEGENK